MNDVDHDIQIAREAIELARYDYCRGNESHKCSECKECDLISDCPFNSAMERFIKKKGGLL